jgi:tetratricopeptide (TPR) repeat protein
MNYSNNYILYPVNRALQNAIGESLGLCSDELIDAAAPDNSVTVTDIFFHTRGNYEQRSFSSNILEPLRDVLEHILTDDFRQQELLIWADLQNRLGNILAALGQRQRDAQWYEKAIACFDKAMQEFTQEKYPLKWAAAQANLGTALQALGRQEADAKLLNKAIDAYTAALLVYSKKDTPEEWMLVMHQLGAALHSHGLLLKGNRNLQKSVVAYKNALALLDADNYAFELTATHNNRGTVLHHLGESEENPERITEALHSYEKALTVSMEQQLPFHLTVIIRVNKATAQNVLAELTKDAVLAQDVADEFELILECFPHALQPLCVKHCEAQLNQARKLAGASNQTRAESL